MSTVHPTVRPYLFFEGCTEEALNFYTKAVGAKIEALMRFSDGPPAGEGQGEGEGCAGAGTIDPTKVMHANFSVAGTQLMASDGRCSNDRKFSGFALSISAADEQQAETYFAALAEGGEIQMPLGPTFFAKSFGMVMDKFGVSWMLVVPAEHPPA